MKISLAPLQGYTDWVFRHAYKKNIGGIDEYYTPFLVLQNNNELKTSHKREVEPYDKRSENLIPQFLCGTAEEFAFFENYFSGLAYDSMNWNLGCPYPMVTKRERGSGLLKFPNRIQEILEVSYQKKINLSVKLRLGLEQDTEVDSIIPILKKFGVSQVILHPRVGKQLYKGAVNIQRFREIFEAYGSYIAYNGDICTHSDFRSLKENFSDLNHLMIGRGVLMDYWLPQKIKELSLPSENERKDQLEKMHRDIYSTYESYLQGETQIMHKMKPFWEYFSHHFENDKKVFKAIKKAVGIKKYEQAVSFAFSQKLK